MATTGISALGNDQIIAVAALSSKSAAQADVASTASYATLDINGNAITSTYLTAVPAGYATTAWVTGKGYLTAVPAGTMNTASLNKSGGLITGYNGTAFAGAGGGASYESTYGTIWINDDDIEGTDSAFVTATPQVYNYNQIYAYQSTVQGTMYTDTAPCVFVLSANWGNTQITANDYNGYYSAFVPENGEHIVTLPGNNGSMQFTAVGDTHLYAWSAVSTAAGTVVELAHKSALNDYQTTAGMSNYATTASVTGKQDKLTFGYMTI